MTDFDESLDIRPEEKKTYQEERAEVKEEQRNKKYDEIKEAMRSRNQFILEMDNLPSQVHRWIDRGAKMTCENAGHPYHEAFKR